MYVSAGARARVCVKERERVRERERERESGGGGESTGFKSSLCVQQMVKLLKQRTDGQTRDQLETVGVEIVEIYAVDNKRSSLFFITHL